MQNTARISLIVAGGLLTLMFLLILLSWVFVGSESFKTRIVGVASQVVGTELIVDGPVGTRLFPAPGLRLEDISMRNGGTEWINASVVDLRLRVRPLLRGRVEVDSVDIMEPNLQITRDSEGAFNFVPANRPNDSNKGRQPLEIRLFRALDANLSFTDLASGEEIEAQGCDWTMNNLEWSPGRSHSSGSNLPNFQGRLSCGKIIYDVMEMTGLEAEVSAQDQRIKISPMTGMLFDGRLNAHLKSDLSGSSPDHSFELELADFRIERFIETFHQEQGAEGSLTFTSQLSFSGKTLSESVASLNGRAELSGTTLVLHGLNLDEQLARYESTQKFNLVDVAAFFVAGPAGLAVTRGYGFASIFTDAGQQTPIRELVSEWDIDNGMARARDVALSTAENRLALAGGLDFVNLRFKDTRVAVVDAEGCAVVEQLIQGEFKDPEIQKPHFLVALVGPLMDIVRRGAALLTDTKCEPFYTGRLEQP